MPTKAKSVLTPPTINQQWNNLLILAEVFQFNCMVHHVDSSWNQIESSLTLMYEKLVQIGFVYYNGEIQIGEQENEESQYHV